MQECRRIGYPNDPSESGQGFACQTRYASLARLVGLSMPESHPRDAEGKNASFSSAGAAAQESGINGSVRSGTSGGKS